MPLANTDNHYGAITKLFHWTIALLIIGMLILGHVMGNISDKPLRGELFGIHKSLGLLILAIMILRLLWRFGNKTPSLPSHLPRWQQRSARANHCLLYIAIILMPITGIVMSTTAGYPPSFFGLFTLAAPIVKSKALAGLFSDVHITLSWIIVALLSLHILAALKHHFIHRDYVLTRMLPFGRRKTVISEGELDPVITN